MIQSSALDLKGETLSIISEPLAFFSKFNLCSNLCQVGLDVAHHVQDFLSEADMGHRMGGSNAGIMSDMVKKGMLGRKPREGFSFMEEKKAEKSTLKLYQWPMICHAGKYIFSIILLIT